MTNVVSSPRTESTVVITLPRDNITRVSNDLKAFLAASIDDLFGQIIILDVTNTDKIVKPTDFSVLRANLSDFGLAIAGVKVRTDAQAEGARTAGLTAIGWKGAVRASAAKPLVARIREESAAEIATKAPRGHKAYETEDGGAGPGKAALLNSGTAGTLVVRKKIRSGMELQSDEANIAIVGDVAQASDIIARGSIHVLGALCGRAIAGCEGDTRAVIVAKNFLPDLVSIAGIYLSRADIPARFMNRHVLVSVHEGNLNLELI